MKSTVVSHEKMPVGHEEIHRFTFSLDDGDSSKPYQETISLRTARVIVAHLADGNAFIQMLRAIVAIAVGSKEFDTLIGQQFEDKFVEDAPSVRTPESGVGWKNAHE